MSEETSGLSQGERLASLQSTERFVPREVCWTCRRARTNCYCARVVPFDPGIDFLLIVHPREARNPVGTARIAHRFLLGSTWLECAGRSLDREARFQTWLEARAGRISVLYPGSQAQSVANWHTQSSAGYEGGRPAVIVLDGTWAQARQMMRQSQRLQALPQLSFQTHRRSAYEIREQPLSLCLSSLEAIHELLSQRASLVARERSLVTGSPEDEGSARMLQTFLEMVRFQVAKGGPARGKAADRGVRRRV